MNAECTMQGDEVAKMVRESHRTCDECAKLHVDGCGRRVCDVHGQQLCNHQSCECFNGKRVNQE